MLAALRLGACKPHDDKPKPKPYASDTLPVDALERSGAICDRLVTSGVAKNCVKVKEAPPSKLHSRIVYISTFEPVGGFPKDKCSIYLHPEQKDFDGFMADVKLGAIPDDDFPRSVVTSTANAMWHASVTCDAGIEHGNKWDACREKKTVAECAKASPAEYAKYRALHDAALRIVDGR